MIQLNEKYKSFTSKELHLWNCFDLFSIAWNLNVKISTNFKKRLNYEAAIF